MADIVATALQTCVQQWSAALQADSVDPEPHYNADGEMVDPVSWRNDLLKNIQDAQAQINARSSPLFGYKRGRLGCW